MTGLLKRIDWRSTLFLTLTPPAAVIASWQFFAHHQMKLSYVLLFVFFYYATGMSITAGYHRLFSHKTYSAHWSVRLFYALFGAATFQNSILKWGIDHRLHHRYVDEDKDPYCAKKGMLYSHIGWLFIKNETAPAQIWAKDLTKDKIVMWQDKYYTTIAIAMGFGLPTLLGAALGSWLAGFAFAGLVRIVFVHHVTFLINSACHFFGRQPYSDSHTAKDNPVIAFFTYGEGYHNFHHEFANDYRNGIRWFDFDPTKWAIDAMKYVGLTTELKRTSDDVIMVAKMRMVERQLHSQLEVRSSDFDKKFEAFKIQLEHFREQARNAAVRFQALKAEKKEKRRQLAEDALAKLRIEVKKAREDMRHAQRQWEAYIRFVMLNNS